MSRKKTKLLLLALIASLMTYSIISIVQVVTPRKIGTADAEHLFEKYICSPVPDGIDDLTASGGISMASTTIIIKFRVDNLKTALHIIEQGGFRALHSPECRAIEIINEHLTDIDEVYSKGDNQAFPEIVLGIDAKELQVCFVYIDG